MVSGTLLPLNSKLPWKIETCNAPITSMWMRATHFLWELNGSSVRESGYRSLQRLIYGLPISNLDLGKKKLPLSGKKNPCGTWCNLNLSSGRKTLLPRQPRPRPTGRPATTIFANFWHVSRQPLFILFVAGMPKENLNLGRVRGHYKKKKGSSSFIREHTSVLCKP